MAARFATVVVHVSSRCELQMHPGFVHCHASFGPHCPKFHALQTGVCCCFVSGCVGVGAFERSVFACMVLCVCVMLCV